VIIVFARATTSAIHRMRGTLAVRNLVRISLTGGVSTAKSTKTKRRRNAESNRAIDRSAVFMVPIRYRFSGSRKSEPEYCRRAASPRYSSRK